MEAAPPTTTCGDALCATQGCQRPAGMRDEWCPSPMACTGCGSRWSDAELAERRRADPRIIACCPERDMRPIAPRTFGWLIEATPASPLSSPRYFRLCDYSPVGWDWTEDHQLALRLGRQEDAEAVARAWRLTGVRVAQHAWG